VRQNLKLICFGISRVSPSSSSEYNCGQEVDYHVIFHWSIFLWLHIYKIKATLTFPLYTLPFIHFNISASGLDYLFIYFPPMCLIDSSIHDSPTIFSPSLACKLRGEKNCNHNKELRAWRSIIILGDTEQSWKEPCMIVMCHDRWMRIGSDKLRFPARSLYLC
jgi:hypothetical protein